jgi:hypothetical protein
MELAAFSRNYRDCRASLAMTALVVSLRMIFVSLRSLRLCVEPVPGPVRAEIMLSACIPTEYLNNTAHV